MSGPATQLAGVVLAAGAGTRLRPLTDLLPKALCPVGNVALVDLALARVRALTPSVAVNVHHGRDRLLAHLGDGVHVSVEQREALGTAGALGALRDWVAGRPVLVTNADAWLPAGIEGFTDGWDGVRTRLLVVESARADFDGRWRYAGACLMPWTVVRLLRPQPGGLYEVAWRQAHAAGRLELVPTSAPFVDCGTPADYLRANLAASGGDSVVGAGADVQGRLVRSVVWPGGRVRAGETLVESIRAGTDVTVAARPAVGQSR